MGGPGATPHPLLWALPLSSSGACSGFVKLLEVICLPEPLGLGPGQAPCPALFGRMGLSREQTRQQSRPREAGALGWEAAIPYTAECAGSGRAPVTQGGLVTARSANAVLSVAALAPARIPGRRLR